MLKQDFFNRDPCIVAQALLGKIICVRYQKIWLKVRIVETEAYYLNEKASHASLGFTEKRKALFMPAGTIYMYYARGGDSLNVSAKGEGNAVLIKGGMPYLAAKNKHKMIEIMQSLNPPKNTNDIRPIKKLCSGQTLLCKSLGLKVPDWNQKQFDEKRFYIQDENETVSSIIQTTRLGIPHGRDGHLPYRFIDAENAHFATENPLRKRIRNYEIIKGSAYEIMLVDGYSS